MDDNMRLGDILIFEAGNDWIGKSISFLTNSTVSHTAMVLDQDLIVEMWPEGIVAKRFHQAGKGRRAYFMRMEPERDPVPLLRTARGYLDEGVEYDSPALFLLAGLLVYRSIRPTQRLFEVADLILYKACLQLDKLIQQIRRQGKKAMVCSQMVYQCYLDCGPDYIIDLEGGDFQSQPDDSLRLIDLLDRFQETDAAPEQPVGEQDSQELARRLYEILVTPDSRESIPDFSQLGAIVPGVRKFLSLAKELLDASGSDLPMDALFVTPADLLNHSRNLRRVGEYLIERD